MSNMDTRGSVIFGVCQHDPERWREFDAIYRPMLFAFLRKQGLPEFRGQTTLSRKSSSSCLARFRPMIASNQRILQDREVDDRRSRRLAFEHAQKIAVWI